VEDDDEQHEHGGTLANSCVSAGRCVVAAAARDPTLGGEDVGREVSEP
jgi:hypothetical protein